MKYRKRFMTIVLSATMLLSMAACADSSQNGNGNEKTDLTICLDWTPNTNHTGLYVAASKGYYAEAGLNVRIVQPVEDSATAICAAGQAEFAITAQDSLASAFARENPLGITAVAAILQHNTSGIISRTEDGITSPAKLEGYTYSTWNSPIELATMKEVMEADGGDFSKVNLIPNVIVDEAGALREHQTDSVWVYYGWSCISAELSELDFNYFYFKDIDPVFDYYTPVIIANNDFLNGKAEIAKAFLSATAKGYEYAIEHPEEAAQILIDGDTTGSLSDSQALVTASQLWMSEQYKAETEQWGYIDPVRWNGFYNWLNENELVSQTIPENTGFSNDYLA